VGRVGVNRSRSQPNLTASWRAASGIADLVAHDNSYTMPDAIDIANWPGSGETSTADPYVPANLWANHQRIHQCRGDNETRGGATINIGSDYLDVQSGGSTSA
jgi:hypothetical protein